MTRRKLTPARLARIAGAFLFIAGAAAFMGIITAESLYPSGYTTGGSMISDLGGTEPPNSIVVQPSAAIFDATMCVTGILIILGALCVYAANRRKSLAIPLALFGIGALGVGIFPGHTGGIHQIFAMLAFVAGGVAAMLSLLSLRGPLRYLSVGLGAITLVNFVAYAVLQGRWFVTGLGLGGLERWIAYPIVLWVIALGGYLLGTRDDAAGAPQGATV
jgi:hypothetical membrane protein